MTTYTTFCFHFRSMQVKTNKIHPHQNMLNKMPRLPVTSNILFKRYWSSWCRVNTNTGILSAVLSIHGQYLVPIQFDPQRDPDCRSAFNLYNLPLLARAIWRKSCLQHLHHMHWYAVHYATSHILYIHCSSCMCVQQIRCHVGNLCVNRWTGWTQQSVHAYDGNCYVLSWSYRSRVPIQFMGVVIRL